MTTPGLPEPDAITPATSNARDESLARERGNIRLTGRLVCQDEGQAAIVQRFLPRHVELSRAEPGCLCFDVDATDDPLVWTVAERFSNRVTFDAHQARVRVSEWGRETAGIARDYVVEADSDD
jgi:quinol monooxygenase YgiN